MATSGRSGRPVVFSLYSHRVRGGMFVRTKETGREQAASVRRER